MRQLKSQKPIQLAHPPPSGNSSQSLDILRFNYGTPFLGRRKELQELSQLLENPSARYVCVVGLGLRRVTGHAGASACSLEHLAMVYTAKQDWLAAESAAAESEQLYQQDSEWAEVSRLVLVQGDLLRLQGAWALAFGVYQTAWTIAKQNRNTPLANEILLRFAWLAETFNQHVIACQLLGWVGQQVTADFHTRQLARQSLLQLQCDETSLLPKDLSGAFNWVLALEKTLA